ncbi:MAG: DUF2231 domain-containing protein [Planctomycetota bacterium]
MKLVRNSTGLSLLALVAVLAGSRLVRGLEPQVADLGAQVRAIFASHCVECHGAHLPKPKGKFGYIEDLARVAANPEFVVRGQPDDSELYRLLMLQDPEDRMPPMAAKSGPLSATQIETIRNWIAAGAPLPRVSGEPAIGAATTAPPPPPTFWPRLARFASRFHPVVVHFPIALVFAAGLAEVLGILAKRKRRSGQAGDPILDSSLATTVRFCLWVGCVGSVAAAPLGWIAGGLEGYQEQNLFWHRWFGVSSAVWAAVTLVVGEWSWRSGRTPSSVRWFRWLLFGLVVLTGLTGHFGGVIVFGPDHFSW